MNAPASKYPSPTPLIWALVEVDFQVRIRECAVDDVQVHEADAKRLKALEKENAELKKMYAEAMLGMKVLKNALGKKL